MLRTMSLPRGWYPRDTESVERSLEEWATERGTAIAAIVPHAGWSYSGKTAAIGIASLQPDVDLVVVFGGHRGDEDGIWIDRAEAFETPLGTIALDREGLSIAASIAILENDRYAGRDNSVEVLLPMIKRYFKNASALLLRPPASMSAFDFAKDLASALRSAGKRVVAVASSDLTHYGPRYGYAPSGTGAEAARWAREVNDAALIKAAVNRDVRLVLELSLERHAACSPGAIVACLGFAEGSGASEGRLLDYASSLDVVEDENFVGYAAISFAYL